MVYGLVSLSSIVVVPMLGIAAPTLLVLAILSVRCEWPVLLDHV